MMAVNLLTATNENHKVFLWLTTYKSLPNVCGYNIDGTYFLMLAHQWFDFTSLPLYMLA